MKNTGFYHAHLDKSGLEVIIFFMLNSAEHEILDVHKYKYVKKLSHFHTQISLKCYFSAHKCENANNIVDILTFTSRKKFLAQLS